MTSIRKIAMTCGMAVFAGVLMAQTPAQSASPAAGENSSANQPAMRQHRVADPAREARHLGKKLGLSSDQVAQLTPILADRTEQIKSLRAD